MLPAHAADADRARSLLVPTRENRPLGDCSRRNEPAGRGFAVQRRGDGPQHAIAPGHALVPAVEREPLSARGGDLRDELRRPWIVLAALGAHARIGGPEPPRVRLDPAARV